MKEDTKKHDLEHDFWHEGEHQKAHLFQKESTKKHNFCTMQGGAHQSTICCMKEDIKKHDLKHDFWHEGKHQKVMFSCRKENTQVLICGKLKPSVYLSI